MVTCHIFYILVYMLVTQCDPHIDVTYSSLHCYYMFIAYGYTLANIDKNKIGSLFYGCTLINIIIYQFITAINMYASRKM